jgi:outer membrane murein-binding lipoprotein Lpp
MKTQNNITRTAARYTISAAIAFVSFTSVSAAGNLNSEISAIDSRLEDLNSSIEKSLKYEAPAVNAEAEAVTFDAALAIERLDNLTAAMEASIRFETPDVDVLAEVREAEAAAAAERLESLSLAVEKTIRFNPADYNLSSL